MCCACACTYNARSMGLQMRVSVRLEGLCHIAAALRDKPSQVCLRSSAARRQTTLGDAASERERRKARCSTIPQAPHTLPWLCW